MGPDDIPPMLWGAVLDHLKSKLPPNTINPMGGMDNAPIPPSVPVIPVPPFTPHFGMNEATISLPANQGANFEGYLDYSFNPFSPGSMGINGGGLRYRYQF